MAHSIIAKKAEKAEKILKQMSDKDNEEEFKKLFRKLYPEDWEKIKRKYLKEERKTKPGKSHPMPNPNTYLHNMFKTALSKHKE